MEDEWLVADSDQKPVFREIHQEACETLVALSKYLFHTLEMSRPKKGNIVDSIRDAYFALCFLKN